MLVPIIFLVVGLALIFMMFAIMNENIFFSLLSAICWFPAGLMITTIEIPFCEYNDGGWQTTVFEYHGAWALEYLFFLLGVSMVFWTLLIAFGAMKK